MTSFFSLLTYPLFRYLDTVALETPASLAISLIDYTRFLSGKKDAFLLFRSYSVVYGMPVTRIPHVLLSSATFSAITNFSKKDILLYPFQRSFPIDHICCFSFSAVSASCRFSLPVAQACHITPDTQTDPPACRLFSLRNKGSGLPQNNIWSVH